VAVVHALVLLAAVVAVVSLPLLLTVAISAEEALESAGRAIRRGLRGWRNTPRRVQRRTERAERRAHRLAARAQRLSERAQRRSGRVPRWRMRRLAWALRHTPSSVPAEPAGPPIEQVAADLRRLGQQRLGIATRSPVWFAAVQRAYDDRLQVACRELEIEEHLAELEGVDLEIERVRVEGALQAAGMTLGDSEAGHQTDPR
jgi:hypothetical protein